MNRLPPPHLLVVFIIASALSASGSAANDSEKKAMEDFLAGRHASAHGIYSTMAKAARPQRADLHRAAAAAARYAGMVKDAAMARQAALKLEPEDRWNLFRLARLHLIQGTPEDALALLTDATGAWEHITKARALHRLGRAKEALASLHLAIKADNQLSISHQLRGEILETTGKMDEAAAAYAAATTIDPSLTHLNLRLARIETALNMPAEAFEKYRRHLLVDSRDRKTMNAKQALAKLTPALAEHERASKELSEQAWTKTEAPCIEPLPPSPLTAIAVGVATELDSFRMKCAHDCTIASPGGRRITIPAQTEIIGDLVGDRLRLAWQGGGTVMDDPVHLMATDPAATFAVFNVHFEKGFYWSNRETRFFRGSIEIRLQHDRLVIVNHVQLEDLLLSIVPSEMPANWSMEALKAQSIAARTETLRKLRRHRRSGYNVCASQHCAVYRGTANEAAATSRAVRDTRGMALMTASGRPLDTVYAANCGGRGSDAGAIWGSDSTILPATCDLKPEAETRWGLKPENPDDRDRFLYSRPSSYCDLELAALAPKTHNAYFRWVRSYSEDELADWIDRRYSLGRLRSIRVGEMTPEGWITSITIVGSSGTKTVRRDSIRGALNSVRSNCFTIERLPASEGIPVQYLIVGGGWGHGAGMCQDGAQGMALAGKNYSEILAHYYPKGKLTTLYK